MELTSRLFKRKYSKQRSKIEVSLLIVMDEPTNEEKLSQQLQTNSEQIKGAITYLNG